MYRILVVSKAISAQVQSYPKYSWWIYWLIWNTKPAMNSLVSSPSSTWYTRFFPPMSPKFTCHTYRNAHITPYPQCQPMLYQVTCRSQAFQKVDDNHTLHRVRPIWQEFLIPWGLSILQQRDIRDLFWNWQYLQIQQEKNLNSFSKDPVFVLQRSTFWWFPWWFWGLKYLPVKL